MRKRALINTEPALHKHRRLDHIPSALKRRVQPGQEIVGMSGDDATSLDECGRGPAHDEGQGQGGPGEVFHRDLEEDEVGFCAAIVLGEGVDQSEGEGRGEDVGGEEEAGEALFEVHVLAGLIPLRGVATSRTGQPRASHERKVVERMVRNVGGQNRPQQMEMHHRRLFA